MAILNPVILPAKKLADGRHKVRISLAHNGETKYIVTDIIIDSANNLKGHSICKCDNAAYLTTKLKKLINHYDAILDSIEYKNSLSCGEVLKLLKNGGQTNECTIEDAFQCFISQSRAKESSITQYKVYWKSIEKSLDTSIKLSQFSKYTLVEFEKKLSNKKFTPTSIRCMIVLLKAVYSNAVESDLFKANGPNPFNKFKLPPAAIRQNWLTVDQLKAIRDYEFKSVTRRIWKDVFMLSFYLGGINLADIKEINWKEVMEKKKIKYKRKKVTGNLRKSEFVEYDLPQEAYDIISSLMRQPKFNKLLSGVKNLNTMRLTMNNLQETLGINRVTFYSARKTFSQIAFHLGINSYVIDYILGHSLGSSSKSCLYHYVYVTPEMATQAIRKVLDFIK